jgi:hypothetical protein
MEKKLGQLKLNLASLDDLLQKKDNDLKIASKVTSNKIIYFFYQNNLGLKAQDKAVISPYKQD